MKNKERIQRSGGAWIDRVQTAEKPATRHVEVVQRMLRERRALVHDVIAAVMQEQEAAEAFATAATMGNARGARISAERLGSIVPAADYLRALDHYDTLFEPSLRALNRQAWSGDDAPIPYALTAKGNDRAEELLNRTHDAAVKKNKPAMPGANLPTTKTTPKTKRGK